MKFLCLALILVVLAVTIQFSEAGNRDECTSAATQCPADVETECAFCGCQCPLDNPNCKEFCSVYNYDTNGNQLDCQQTAYRCEKKDISSGALVAGLVMAIIFSICCGCCAIGSIVYCIHRVFWTGDSPFQTHASAQSGSPYQPVTQTVQYSGNVQIQQPAYPPGVGYATSSQPVQPVQCTVLGVVPSPTPAPGAAVTVQGVIVQTGDHQMGAQAGVIVQGTAVEQQPISAAMVQPCVPDEVVTATMVSYGDYSDQPSAPPVVLGVYVSDQ